MASTSTFNRSISDLDQLNDSIYVFYKPLDRQHSEDVIFFHDIQQSENDELHLQTWMSSSEPSVCWPKDWLSQEFPQTRISSARYHGAIWKTNTIGHMNLYLIVENLWQDILQIYTENCPVFLVGHGLGGLVIKGIVRAMDEKRSLWQRSVSSGNSLRNGIHLERLTSFLDNIEGVFFYNTPFLGIKLADNTRYFPHSSSLVENLRTLNEKTCHCNEWFREWRTSRCRAAAVLGPLAIKMGLWYMKVEEASARHDLDDFYTAAESDHYDVCKPRDRKDNRYQKLVRLLENRKLPRKIGPDLHTENYSAEIEANKILTRILSEVPKVPKGQGLLLLVQELEKIRKYSNTSKHLMDCFNKARLERTSVTVNFELWTRLYDHEPHRLLLHD